MKPMDQKQFARHLRQCQNTYEELLWQLLRNRRRCNKKFRRQHPIGIYTADFYCAEEKLVIEIDGRDHFTEQGRFHDEARDRFMHSQGIRVLRFTSKQVETEIDWVLAQIDQALGSPSQAPHPPTPSPRVRGEGE
jgi:very-short-patch-repair endonuclease